jgi:hypothetical protein
MDLARHGVRGYSWTQLRCSCRCDCANGVATRHGDRLTRRLVLDSRGFGAVPRWNLFVGYLHVLVAAPPAEDLYVGRSSASLISVFHGVRVPPGQCLAAATDYLISPPPHALVLWPRPVTHLL